MFRQLLTHEVDAVYGGDIIVTGQRPFLDYQPVTSDPYSRYFSQGTSDPWTNYYLSYLAAHAETYANMGPPADVNYSGTDSLTVTNVQNFEAQMVELDAALDSETPFRLNVEGIGTITLAEIQKIFHKMDYTITEGINYPSGGGATGQDASGNYYSNMDKATLSGYAAQLEGGLNFLAFHEVAHNTAALKAYENMLWLHFLNHGGTAATWEGSPEYILNEQAANAVARAILEQLGLAAYPSYATPPYGYGD